MKRIFRSTQDLFFLATLAMAVKGLWDLGMDFANRNKTVHN